MTTPDEPTARKRMPAGCPTPEDCWQNCCHGACLPAPDDTAKLLRASVEMERLRKNNDELLEALQPFVARNSSDETITITVRTADVARARAAIAKAQGGAAC